MPIPCAESECEREREREREGNKGCLQKGTYSDTYPSLALSLAFSLSLSLSLSLGATAAYVVCLSPLNVLLEEVRNPDMSYGDRFKCVTKLTTAAFPYLENKQQVFFLLLLLLHLKKTTPKNRVSWTYEGEQSQWIHRHVALDPPGSTRRRRRP